jgi:hypothetical protein
VTFAFGKPFLQDVVHFCHAVLDEPIEASELLIGVSHLALQSGRQLDEAGPVAERFLASRYAPIVPHLFWGTSRGS